MQSPVAKISKKYVNFVMFRKTFSGICTKFVQISICDMVLHIFNPEHDIALAYNRNHLTMPHAAQELRMNLGWIPAIWANDGDAILVDDIEYAIKASSHFKGPKADCVFVGWGDLSEMSRQIDAIVPWGWDVTISTALAEAGIEKRVLPDADKLNAMRNLSNRKHTTYVLETLRSGVESNTCGESAYVESAQTIFSLIEKGRQYVLKAPWSSSGRGVRFVQGVITPTIEGWVRRIVRQQGGIMLEPYYPKIWDFGMEFTACDDGTIVYNGLSLFHTQNNAYVGNILASEDEKMVMLEKYIHRDILDEMVNRICSLFPTFINHNYVGPFGVDMMVVPREDEKGFLLHPCVEVNLRRTMGHVALNLNSSGMDTKRMMSIVHRVNYLLKISELENNYVKIL